MPGSSTTVTLPLRIDVDALKRRLERGEAVTILDVRAPKAWESSNLKIRGAVRVDPDRVHVDPAWPTGTAVY
jgi:hypothetical protein